MIFSVIICFWFEGIVLFPWKITLWWLVNPPSLPEAQAKDAGGRDREAEREWPPLRGKNTMGEGSAKAKAICSGSNHSKRSPKPSEPSKKKKQTLPQKPVPLFANKNKRKPKRFFAPQVHRMTAERIPLVAAMLRFPREDSEDRKSEAIFVDASPQVGRKNEKNGEKDILFKGY